MATELLLIDAFADIPNELIFRIFSHLDLQGLIISRGVSHTWRTLIPFAPMVPARKEMLDFYDYLLSSPLFFKTRPWVLANLRPFNRSAYITKLTRQYPSLPEEFRIWLLEWPERAVVACSWPGLPRRRYVPPHADNVNITEGTNWLPYPQVSILTYADTVNRKAEHIPGMVVRRSRLSTTWLILDEREAMNGKIFTGLMSHSTMEGSLDSGQLQLKYHFDGLETSWIGYQKRIWRDVEDEAGRCAKAGRDLWASLEDTADDEFGHAWVETMGLGETAWLMRNGFDSQERLRRINDTM